MLSTLGFFLMSAPMFVGAFKMFRKKLVFGYEGIGNMYASFYLSLGIFLFMISVLNSNVFLLTPRTIYMVHVFAIACVLYIGLGFVHLFSFLLIDKKYIAYNFFMAHIIFSFYTMFYYFLRDGSATLLAGDDALFAYWKPGIPAGVFLFSLALVLLAAGTYGQFFFRTALASSSEIIKIKSFIFAIGSVLAAISGTAYFLSSFISDAQLPYILAADTIPGIIGFSLMTAPLFMKGKE